MRPLDPRLLRRARPVRLLLGIDVTLGVVAALLVLVQALLLARITARAFEGTELSQLTNPLIALVAVVVARAAVVWGFEIAGRRAAVTVLSQLRLDVIQRRLHDRPAALDGARSAEIAAAAVTGVDALETTFARYLPQVVLALAVPVFVLALVATIDLVAAGVMLLTLPLVPLFMWLVGRYTERQTRDRWQALVLLSTHFLDVVRGLPTLRAFNRGRVQTQRIADVSEQYRRTTMSTLRVAFLSGTVLELAATLGIALVAVTVGIRLVDGRIGFEPALTVLVLAPELYLPLRNLAAQFHASADTRASTDRLLDLVDEAGRPPRGTVTPPSPRTATIVMEGVEFAYPGRDTPVLRGVDLELVPGETVALAGPSGAGKSTVVALLLGFADPSAGRVMIGSVDLADCDPGSWSALGAWVPQRPTLFRGTVADNIRLGARDADHDRVQAAAALAGADAFVSRLPDGYETVVGDGGRELSAGERRRIALARAFLRDAPFVILDEPTADLDPESAELIEEAVDRLRNGRTVLLVAHRPALAERADRVVRLEAGRILEPSREVA